MAAIMNEAVPSIRREDDDDDKGIVRLKIVPIKGFNIGCNKIKAVENINGTQII